MVDFELIFCIMSPLYPFLVLENLQIEMCKILMQIDDSNSKKVGAFILIQNCTTTHEPFHQTALC